MPDVYELERKIEQIIDELKGLCNQNGLGNQASEEMIITSVFLYKFLNDKFMYNLKRFATEIGMEYQEVLLNENDELDAFYDTFSKDVAFEYEDTIEFLINKVSNDKFYETFDNALIHISNNAKNEIFCIKTSEGTRKPLFTRITEVVEESKRNNFAKAIFSIICQEKFDFTDAFVNNFDFYSRIFEYLIKDYNVASGTYAEYFTPQAVSFIISKILANMSKVEDKIYEVYDPAAGSGSLVLHLANELGKGKFGNKAHVYTQDISNKSSRFLRINMLLNGLTNSLDNILEGNTLDTPAHYNIPQDPGSGVKKFDYITSNPPFKVDFSSTRDSIEAKWESTDRFFAGVPNIPNAKKESMSIYLMFIQHILYSLKEDGKAAVVVPTGFITAQSGIELKIRQRLIDNGWLKGVVSMPSNIFANTGTNVSVLFIDKSNKDGKVTLMDASKLGEKKKDGKNQRTILKPDEVNIIIDTFVSHQVIEDFSVSVTYDKIKEKNYSLSAGQYFEIKMNKVELTKEQFSTKMNSYKINLNNYFNTGKSLENEIKKRMEDLKFEDC